MNKLFLRVHFPESKISRAIFYIHCGVLLALVFLFFALTDFYHSLDGETGPIENAGAAFLLTASVFLFLAIKAGTHKKILKSKLALLVLGCAAFFWAAGEEISWGQYYFGWATPDWLATINSQGETNLSKINKKLFDRIVEHLTWIMVLVPLFLHLRGKERIAGFRAPEYPIAFGFAVLPTYHRYKDMNIEFYHLVYVGFAIYFAAALLKRARSPIKNAFIALATMTVIWYSHYFYDDLFRRDPNIFNEVREAMFGFLCMGYAIQIWSDARLGRLSDEI